MYCSWLGQKYLVVFFPFSRKQLMNQQSLVRASTFWPSSPSSSSLSSSRSHSCGVLRSSTHTHTQCAHLILSNYVKVTMQIEIQQYGGPSPWLKLFLVCLTHNYWQRINIAFSCWHMFARSCICKLFLFRKWLRTKPRPMRGARGVV